MNHRFRSCIVFLLCTALCCAFGLIAAPRAAAADALSNRQKAVVEAAWAYYYSNPFMQYDSAVLTDGISKYDGVQRRTDNQPPEAANSHRHFYSVCSAYCYEVYHEAIGYKILNSPLFCTTAGLHDGPEELKAYQWRKDSGVPVETMLKEVEAAMQPGDIVVASGHAMMYIGDNTLLHCSGKKYSIEDGTDAVEKSGGIRRENMKSFLLEETGSYYLAKKDPVTLIRPLNVTSEENFPVTEAMKTRLQYPGMKIDRMASIQEAQSTFHGDTLTYSITIKNNSEAKYTGLTVTETVPALTTLVAGSVNEGGTTSGSTITWHSEISPGKSVTYSYDVTVTGKLGKTIVNDGGYVGKIPSNSIQTVIGGEKLTKAVRTAIASINPISATKLSWDARPGTDFAERLYKELFDIELELPETAEIVNALFEKKMISSETFYVLKQNPDPLMARMLVHRYFGGTKVWTENAEVRTLDLSFDHLEPGDILIKLDNFRQPDKAEVWVFTGSGLLTSHELGKTIMKQNESGLTDCFSKNGFFVLRPTQAYEDIDSLKAVSFKDVSAGAWYEKSVKHLAAKGIVNGYADGTFQPYGTVTYGQALKLVMLATGYAEQAATGSHWASGYLSTAVSDGLTTYAGDLNGPISRLEFAQIAAKALKATTTKTSSPFSDTSDPAVLALHEAGVIDGLGDGTFGVNGTLNRAQISKIIDCIDKL